MDRPNDEQQDSIFYYELNKDRYFETNSPTIQ